MPEPATPDGERCLAGLVVALTGLSGGSLERCFASLADALAVDAIVLLGLDPPLVRTIAGPARRVPGEATLPQSCLAALVDGRLVRGGPEVAAALVRPQSDPGSALISAIPGLVGPPTAALALYTNLSPGTWSNGQELALRGFVGGLAGWLAARGLQSVLDALPQRITWKDPGQRWRGANRAFTRASGQSPPLGRSDDDERPDHPARLETAALPGGREQWFWTSRTGLDGGGQVLVRDDVTAALTLATQLTQAHRVAAIGRLAAGVGNQLRPIVDSLTADIAALRQDPTSDAITSIERASQSAEDLTRQLTALTRRQLLAPADIVPVQLLSRLAPTLARLLGPGFELHVAPAGLRCTLRLDPRLFEQLIVHLVRHVRDNLAAGQLGIEVAADTLDPAAAHPLALPPGEYVRVGLVIGPPLATTDEHGLHITLARTIASHAGGSIDVPHDPTTRIDVLLPRSFATRSEPDVRPPLDTRGSESLLLVEDDPAVRSLLATVLRHLGYHVLATDDLELAAQSVETGLSGQVQTTRVALALVSATLPGHKPADALRRLRSAAPALRILWISPAAAAPTVTSDPLVVPCSFEAVAVRVRQALDARP